VTTEVCVHTTVREANDRGYECVVLSDCVGSYFPEFHRVALEMIKAQGGIFGWVSDSEAARRALGRIAPRSTASAAG
jgi:nicotinamidase-related amidase